MGILQYFGLALQKLTPQEKDLCIKLGFDEELMRLLKTETSNPLSIENSNFIEAAVSETKSEQAYIIIKNCKKRFSEKGMCLFAHSEEDSETRVVTFKANKESDIINYTGTTGKTPGTSNETLAKLLDKWDGLFDFSIQGAGSDWMQLEVTTLPEDQEAFAEEVFAVCPDIKSEIDSTDKLISSIKNSKILGFWWD